MLKIFLKKYFPLAVIYVLVIAVFYKGLFNYFFQDDFIVMYIGWIKNLTDIKKLFFSFQYYPDLSYRPLTFLIFGSTAVHLFRLQPFLFHSAIFLLYFFTLFLLWRMLKDFFPDSRLRYYCLFLYAVSSIHFGVLYWMTASYVLLATLFLIITFHYLYRQRFLAVSFYIFALLTNEGLFTFPIFVLIDKFFRKNGSLNLWVYFIIAGISLVFRRVVSRFQALSDYRIGNPLEIVSTFKWYFFRAINMPESVRSAPFFLKLIILVLIVKIVLILLSALYYRWKERKLFSKNIILGLSWFLLFGFIYFLLPFHLSGYYLHTALIGFCITLVSILEPFFFSKNRLSRVSIYLFAASWFMLSFLGVEYLTKTSWIVWRGDIARKYISKTRNLYPTLPKGATVIFKPAIVSADELSNTLYHGKALELYYKDSSLNIIFSKEYIPRQNDYVIID